MMRYVRGVVRRLKSILPVRRPPEALGLTLLGDRDIEWSWVAANTPQGPGEVLDFGPGGSYLGLIAARRDFNVTSIDLGHIERPYLHPKLRFIQGDLLKMTLPDAHFDLILNCSTVEHVGLAGRYGVTESEPDGDLAAMSRLLRLMKPGAVMLATVPVGRDAVFVPLHRVYGPRRLPMLLRGYAVEKEQYWVKDGLNRWVAVGRDEALNRVPQERCYGLGCFVLKRV